MAHSGPLAKQQRCIFLGKGSGAGAVAEALPAYLDILIIHRETRECSVQLN